AEVLVPLLILPLDGSQRGRVKSPGHLIERGPAQNRLELARISPVDESRTSLGHVLLEAGEGSGSQLTTFIDDHDRARGEGELLRIEPDERHRHRGTLDAG